MTWMLYDPCACGNDQVDALAKAAAQDGFVAPTYAPEDDFADAVRVRGGVWILMLPLPAVGGSHAAKRVRRDVSGLLLCIPLGRSLTGRATASCTRCAVTHEAGNGVTCAPRLPAACIHIREATSPQSAAPVLEHPATT